MKQINSNSKMMPHGGDRYRNKVEFDYSISVNPLGLPASVKQEITSAIEELEYYPDLHYQALRQALAETYQVKWENVVCGNGASELLMAVIHAFRPKKVLLPVPSFSGYQWALQASDAEVTYYQNVDGKGHVLDQAFFPFITEETDLLFLTNPNNPTGRYIDQGILEAICKRCEETGTILVLDECFMELSDTPELHSMIPRLASYKNLLLLHAFTKSFAMPGIRLGYLLCQDEEKISLLERHLPEWNLSTLAQRVGVAALKEREFLTESKAYIRQEREFLKAGLEELGFLVEESVTNFMLIRYISKNPDCKATKPGWLYEKLLEHGILIRDCSDYQGLEEGTYRIAVRDHKENVSLMITIRCILNEM